MRTKAGIIDALARQTDRPNTNLVTCICALVAKAQYEFVLGPGLQSQSPNRSRDDFQFGRVRAERVKIIRRLSRSIGYFQSQSRTCKYDQELESVSE